MSTEKNIEAILKQNCPAGTSGKMEKFLELNERERLALLFQEVFGFSPVSQVDPPGLHDKIHELEALESQVKEDFALLRELAPRIAELSSQIEALRGKKYFNDQELRKIVALVRPPLSSKSTRASKAWWSPDDYAKTPWLCGLSREGQYIIYLSHTDPQESRAVIFSGSVETEDQEKDGKHWTEVTQIKVDQVLETRRVDPDSLTSLSSTNKVLVNLLKEYRDEKPVHTGGYGSYNFAYVPREKRQEVQIKIEQLQA